MKQIRSFMLGLVCLVCMQASAYDFSAVSTYVEEPMTYEVTLYYSINPDGKTVTVTKGPSEYNATLVSIPETVEWEGKTYTVTTIGYRSFEYSKLGIVLMANTITDIQDSAFERSDVDSVRFSKNLRTIGDHAFDQAEDLKCVVLHEGLERIGNYAFHQGGYYSHPGLQRVFLPNSLTDIGERAFSYQIKLGFVKLPKSLKELKTGTFYYCPKLKEIELPEPLEIIGESAFQQSGLRDVNFPNSLKQIGANAFNQCSLYGEIALPDNIEIIGEGAFDRNKQMTSISFPKRLKVLPKDVCQGCDQLVSINIPEGVETVEYGAFSYCERLSHVVFPESVKELGDAIFMYSGIVDFSFPKGISEIPRAMFANCNYLTEYHIPNTITSIGSSAFRCCSNLSLVEIPESVTRIEVEAFDDCEVLKDVVLPPNLTFIGASAFRDCDSLSKIEIPSSVEEIGGSAFANCDKLNSVVIPHETSVIGQFALDGCPNLVEVHCQRAKLPRVSGMANYPKVVDDGNKATLYVPRGAKATYEASSEWNNFMAIVEEDVPDVYYELGAKVLKGKGSVVIGEQNIVSNKMDALLNSAVTVAFVPAEGYMIETVLCNGEDITFELNETLQYAIASVEANYVFEVYYKERPVVLHLSSGQGGSIDMQFEKGECFTCNFQPEEGWAINTIMFNGRDVTAEWNETSGYTTPKITSESTLSVSFELLNSIISQSATRMKAYSKEKGVLTLEGMTVGEQVCIYSANGQLEKSFKCTSCNMNVSLPANAVYVIKTENGVVKVGM